MWSDVNLEAIAKGARELDCGIFAQFYTPEVLDQLIPVALAPDQLKTQRSPRHRSKSTPERKIASHTIEYGFSLVHGTANIV